MKMNGKVVDANRVEVVVIPRSGGELVFKAKAVLDYGDFEKLFPAPLPPNVLKPGGIQFQNVEDPTFKAKQSEWASARFDFMVIESLSATEGLEWETVDKSKSETWKNWQSELTSSGLSPVEINRILDIVLTACGLNQDKIEQATKAFLAGQAQA